jgi:hypothetical protein
MYSTKQVLREELYLHNKKKLLSEHSLLLIEDDYYVTTILGVDKSLFENNLFFYKKTVIEQQIIVENMIDSINSYLGSVVQKGKEKSLQLIKTIKDTKELAILFKNILLDPKLMEEAIENVKKKLNETIVEVKKLINNILTKLGFKIQGFTDKLTTFLDKILEYGNEFLNSKGWVGFVTMLGLTVMLMWCKKNWLDKLLNLATEQLENQIKNITSVVNIFNSLKELISDSASNLGVDGILNWFIGFGKKEPLIGIVFSAIEIVNIISEILIPTVKTITTRFNLTKT